MAVFGLLSLERFDLLQGVALLFGQLHLLIFDGECLRRIRFSCRKRSSSTSLFMRAFYQNASMFVLEAFWVRPSLLKKGTAFQRDGPLLNSYSRGGISMKDGQGGEIFPIQQQTSAETEQDKKKREEKGVTMTEELIPTPAVFGGSLTRTFEYRTKGVPQSPQVRWTVSTSERISCPLLVDQGVIYLGDEQGYFSAIEASSGHLLWRFATDAVTQFAQEINPRSGVIAACLDGAIGYIATEPTLYELDLRNGQALCSWKLDYDELDYDEYNEDDSFDPALDKKCYGSCLDVSGDLLVFFNEWRGETKILRRSTGEWVDEQEHAMNVPTIFDGKIYGFYMWNNNGDVLFAATDLLATDEVAWMYCSEGDQPDPTWYIFLDELNETQTHTIPILDGTIFAMGDIHSDIPGREDEEGLLAVDATTGYLKWHIIYPDKYSRDYRRIAVASDLVFIGTNYGVEAVDIQAHHTRWTRETAVGTAHLFVAAPLLYVVDDEGNLTALDAQTGEPRWGWQGQGGMLDKQATFCTIADGTLYVVAGCTLYALN